MMEKIAAYSLRPIQRDDQALLLDLYGSTRADEMALVPWDVTQKQVFVQMQFLAQQEYYQTYFPHACHEIVLDGGEAIGRLYVDRRETEIHILDLTLLPQRRAHGIGTQILLDLMKEAARAKKSVSIFVESFNRSMGLFHRLGFTKKEESGPLCLMEWKGNSHPVVVKEMNDE